MSTSSSGNPTTAKHQLVSPEGFLRPVEGLPEGVTKLVICVGGDKEKLREVLGACEKSNGVKPCTELSTLRRMINVSSESVKYLVLNYRNGRTFTFISTGDNYKRFIQKGVYYEVSYDLFIEKLRWAERALLFQGYVEELGLD